MRFLELTIVCQLQALRDIYLIYKSVQQEEQVAQSEGDIQSLGVPQGLIEHLRSYANQYKELFIKRRLRNALISSSMVALAQQLCGSKSLIGLPNNPRRTLDR